MIDVIASIPSPSSNRLGPFHMYGLMIALGVIAAVELGRRRWRERGGEPDDVYAIAFLAVPASHPVPPGRVWLRESVGGQALRRAGDGDSSCRSRPCHETGDNPADCPTSQE